MSTKFSYWTSSDSGKSWTDESAKFGENVIISLMQGSDVDRDRLVFLEAPETKRDERAIFVSKDGMKTMKEIILPPGVTASSITFHPSQVDWFLLQDFSRMTLWVSRDFGETLDKLSDSVSPQKVYWGDEKYETITGEEESVKNWERVVHFERFSIKNYLRNYEVVSCLVPDCSSAGEEYEALREYSKKNDMAEGSFRSENGFLFFESRMNYVSLLHVSQIACLSNAPLFLRKFLMKIFTLSQRTKTSFFSLSSTPVASVICTFLTRMVSSSASH